MKLSRSLRWVLFAGDSYYARGGANDYVGSYATMHAALRTLSNIEIDHSGSWAHVVDISTGRVFDYVGRWETALCPITDLVKRTSVCGWRVYDRENDIPGAPLATQLA